MGGKVLAQYQLSEKLGEGGMGVVWKARDIHLDRSVAIKTLSGEGLASLDRKRRFVNEAKAASALNHPNIVHIYDIAESDGVQFIAMEYVAGKTLEQLIGRKGLPPSEALKYAVQIADALAKAHAAGIIHRDLKPSNIMVAENGLVKVLDFGLAKLLDTPPKEFEETETARMQDTEEGVIVGTAAYMSPEQAEGKHVDARSDIFSFGSVLYEMFTGRRAFVGNSKISTLSAILKQDPEPVGSLAPDLPRDFEKIISRCLRKDPARRFQHMDDLQVALLDLKEESDSGKLITGAVTSHTSERRRPWLRWTLAGLVAVLFVLIGFRFLRPPPHPVPKVVPLTSYPGRQITPALSPDGKQVAFAWDGERGDNFDIYVQLIGAGTPLRLTNEPAYEDSPTWSPDGRYIAFLRRLSDHDEIWTVPALGGAGRKIGEASSAGMPWYSFDQLAWSPDGKFIALPSKNPLQTAYSIVLLSVETGEKRKLTSSPSNNYFGDNVPRFSPDGKHVAFIRASSPLRTEIYVLDVADGNAASEPRRLTFHEGDIFGLDWTPDGRGLVYASGHWGGDKSLWTVPGSGGVPERLGFAGNISGLSVSRSGSQLVYERDTEDLNIWRIPGPSSSERESEPSRFIASTQVDMEPQFSPDGTKIAFNTSRTGGFEIWVCDREGRNPVQLTTFDGPVGSPRWSPDSRWIAFDGSKNSNSDIYVISAAGGPVRRVTTGSSNNVRPSWSKDGRWIYFGSDRNGEQQIWKTPAQGGASVPVVGAKGEEAFESLDGQFVYYAELDAPGIWKVPVAGGERIRVIDETTESHWALTSKGICYFNLTGPAGPALKFYSFASRNSTVLRQFSKNTRIDPFSTAISVSHDGRWILYTQLDQEASDLMMIESFH